ncbi:MAG: M48 family metalloprotease [Actinomycetota bacterium]|nr:M48 family metalloprotease [Actinomycetota bacterium]
MVLTAALAVPLGAVLAVVVGVVVGVGVSLALWRRAPAMLLRALGAEPAAEEQWPRPFGLVDGLCASMGLAGPALWVLDDPSANALVVGTWCGSAVLVVTSGLLTRLDPVQLEGVLAHELVHLKRGDVVVGTMAAVLVLPFAGVLDVGRLVHRLRGRGNELATDQLAVAVTRYPPGLRHGLETMVAMCDAGGPAPAARPTLQATAVGRSTRWLWTVALGPAPRGATAVGELDAPDVRMAALDEL